ncbi:hypothetical protein ACH9L7_19085 (plasmid) [Haloferax sp. S1W]|uniref:hypothetical protein n=1 Tax=Haloferax sp. S1W TaxID=3377110 RepID=UPI0037CA2A52
MTGKNLFPTRRTVLKAIGAAAATGVGSSSAAAHTGESEEIDRSTNNIKTVRVFMGGAVPFELPSYVEQSGLGNADLILISSKTDLSHGNIIAALKTGTPIAFVGSRAFDAAIAKVYKTGIDEVPEFVRTGGLKTGHELDYSFGFEYSYKKSDDVVILFPHKETGTLNTYRLRNSPHTQSSVFAFLQNKLIRADLAGDTAPSVNSQQTDLTTQTVACPPAKDGDSWTCLGSDSIDEPTVCPYGNRSRTHWGAKLIDNTSSNDYFAFETKFQMSPSMNENQNCSSDAWKNDFLTRTITFNDGSIHSYGPHPEEGEFSTSKSIGFNLSGSLNGLSGGGSVGFEKTKSRSGVKTGGFSGNGQVDYDFNIKPGGNIAEETFTSYLGQVVKTANDTSDIDYGYDDMWRWFDPGYFGYEDADKHEETDVGTAYWSV